MQLDDLLCFAIYSAGHAFNRMYHGLLSELGLTYPQYLVMVALWAEDEVTVGCLGEQLRLETSTLTPMLKRLETMGLLQRRRSARDERQVIVSLTEAGRVLQARAEVVPGCIKAATGMPLEEIRGLTRDIRRLEKALQAATPRGPGKPAG